MADERNDLDALVARAAAHDEEAWRQLVDTFAGMIWALARVDGLNYCDAADVEQVVWLRLVESLPKLRHPARIAAWLRTTTRRECRRQRAARRRMRPVGTPGLDRAVFPSPESAVLGAESARAVLRVLNTMPEPCHLLLRLLACDPRPDDATLAGLLGLPVGDTLRARRNCLRTFRRRLAELTRP